VAFLLASERWGSYLGVPSRNFFVPEVGRVVGAPWRTVVHCGRFESRALHHSRRSWRSSRGRSSDSRSGDYNPVALADLAPYIYALVVVAAGWTVVPQGMNRAVIEVALVLHLS